MDNLRVTDRRTGKVWYCNQDTLMQTTAQIRGGDHITIEHMGKAGIYTKGPTFTAIRNLLVKASMALALAHDESADLCALASDAEEYVLEALEMWPTD